MNVDRFLHCDKKDVGKYLVYGNLFDDMPDCGIDSEEIDRVALQFDFMTLTRSRKLFESDAHSFKKVNREKKHILQTSTNPPSENPNQRKRTALQDNDEEENIDPDFKVSEKEFGEKKRKLLNCEPQLFD